jgi:hypothetical protein
VQGVGVVVDRDRRFGELAVDRPRGVQRVGLEAAVAGIPGEGQRRVHGLQRRLVPALFAVILGLDA